MSESGLSRTHGTDARETRGGRRGLHTNIHRGNSQDKLGEGGREGIRERKRFTFTSVS